eukprot:scaffold17810_cov66-Phaeocystis_antarctica.AAC.2
MRLTELNQGAKLYSAPASLCESPSRQSHHPPASALPPTVAGRHSAPPSARAVWTSALAAGRSPAVR